MSDYKDDILRDLKQLVAIESVAMPIGTDERYPFGPRSAEAIDFMVALGQKLGLSTENCDHYACHIQLGEGAEDDYVGVLAHVDVVPVGDGWDTDPLVLTEKDGYLLGRGVADDKGAAMVALYCLKAMKDNGVALKRPVRCIFGGGEEIGMDDMAHYFSKHPLPTFGFTPDADYPACHCEKGILHLHFTDQTDPSVVSIKGGSAINCVADRCTAVLRCDDSAAQRMAEDIAAYGASCDYTRDGESVRFDVKGVSAHAMCPSKGMNAIDAFLLAAANCGVLACDSAESFFARLICGGLRGEKIGVDCRDDMSGELTMNVGTIASENGTTSLGVDIRYPATLDSAPMLQKMTDEAAACGACLAHADDNKPLYVPADSPLIRALGDCYTEITGKPMVPVAMGGGTYARAMGGRGVAFGPVFPDARPSNLHMPNENLSVEELMLHAEICYRAMCRLAQIDPE